MSTSLNFKDGNVYTFKVPQNSANYQVRIANTPKGLWMCIQQSYMQWKLTISPQLIKQTIDKATGGKEQMSYKQFLEAVGLALKKQSENWSIGIMTPVQLQILRGSAVGKGSNNSKIYLILSEKLKKFHFPFTFIMNDICEKEKITDAIKSMKQQLEDLRVNNDKSMSSFSIMTESNVQAQQVKFENDQLKKKIKIYEEALTQKRGAVQIDSILREKNNLQIKAETKKRQEARQITRLKNIHNLMERQINQLRNQVDLINRQLLLLEDSMANPAKLKSHALRVLKSYQTQLRTSKKILMKQTKQIENIKRNMVNSKNNQRKHQTKIKQIQAEIQQAKKKANVKEISNRLHSPGSRGGSSNAGSLKAPSLASNSSDGRAPRSLGNKTYTRPGLSNNLVRQNLLKKTSDIRNDRITSGDKSHLMKTTPNITPVPPRKTDYRPPARPIVSSHQIGAKVNTSQNRNSGNFQPHKTTKSNDSGSVKSAELKKRQFSPAERQKQKQAMQRLTGGANKNRTTNSNPKSNPSNNRSGSNTKPPLGTSNKKIDNFMKPSNTNTKPAFGAPKKDSAKEILNRMKQVRAQYNSRSKNSAAKDHEMAAKVAELTGKK